jgi:hypothetical protein
MNLLRVRLGNWNKGKGDCFLIRKTLGGLKANIVALRRRREYKFFQQYANHKKYVNTIWKFERKMDP